jgi:hypothetical protein
MISTGWTQFSLVAMPPPTKTAKECELKVYDTPDDDRISIIDKKKIRGFWPVYDDSLGERELTVDAFHHLNLFYYMVLIESFMHNVSSRIA